jgi:hypothetical protein
MQPKVVLHPAANTPDGPFFATITGFVYFIIYPCVLSSPAYISALGTDFYPAMPE